MAVICGYAVSSFLGHMRVCPPHNHRDLGKFNPREDGTLRFMYPRKSSVMNGLLALARLSISADESGDIEFLTRPSPHLVLAEGLDVSEMGLDSAFGGDILVICGQNSLLSAAKASRSYMCLCFQPVSYEF